MQSPIGFSHGTRSQFLMGEMQASVRRAISHLVNWLRDEALPFWAGAGTDHVLGGFVERIALDGAPIEEARRTRVVARQVYVFSAALRHGWSNGAADRIDHGLRFLFDRLALPSGTWAASVRVDGSARDDRFDLYEHAFVLFAMGAVYRAQPARTDLPARASSLLARMRETWAHPEAGFYASGPPEPTMLLANPHMHLFEAALEWSTAPASSFQAIAQGLADELAELCLRRLIDPVTGAVREYLGADWEPMPTAKGRVVEPGHQFEWAWLLMRWAVMKGRPDAVAAARRLVTVGEVHGVDPTRGVAVNELDADLVVVDASAKLWPQTERVKAWCIINGMSHSSSDRAHAQSKLLSAVAGMNLYISGAPAGRWREVCMLDGTFPNEPTRASSLYHIVCAIDALASLP